MIVKNTTDPYIMSFCDCVLHLFVANAQQNWIEHRSFIRLGDLAWGG